MTQRNLIAPDQGAEARVAELHRLCDADFVKGQSQRATPNLSPSYAGASLATIGTVAEPRDLDVAIRIAQELLDSDSVLSLREAMRLLLRALGAEPAPRRDLPTEKPTPVGPGCGAPAPVRFEGYSPRNGLAHGSLDLAVYACEEHAPEARSEWLDGLLPYRTATTGTARCGERFDYTTLGGGQ